MKIKIKRMVLTVAVAMTMVITSVVPALAETTETTDLNAENGIMLISTAASTTWTSAKLKAAKVNLSKVASYSYDKIKLTWDALEGVDGYQIYRATSKNGTYKKVATAKGSSSSYINTGLTCGKTYYYKVRAYKKISGKTVYSKYSTIQSAYAKPAKVTINEVYGHTDIVNITLDWKAVRGASGYEQQVNQLKNGKWTGWRSYTYNEDGEKETFTTYASLLKIAKMQDPSGYTYMKTGEKEDGTPIYKKVTVEESVAKSIKKTQAWLDIEQDDSTYKFRVRAYKTVNGKKVYGSWSDAYTLTETIDMNEVYDALRAYTIEYAAKNYPKFRYVDDRPYSTPENSSYTITGAFGGFSIYARMDDVIEKYKDNIERYVSGCAEQNEDPYGFLYIRRVRPGDWEGMWKNDGPETYYQVWMLY